MRAESMKGVIVNAGDFVWIDIKDGVNEKFSGWFWQINQNGIKYFVSKKDKNYKLTVDNANSNQLYLVKYRLDALDFIDKLTLPEIDPEELERRSIAQPIKVKLDKANKELDSFKERRDELNQKIIDKTLEIKDIERQYKNILNGVIPVNHYVYGVHNLNSWSSEFCWINDKNLDIKVNDVIEVETSRGNERAIVTKLEDSKEIRNHKPVVRKIDKLP